MQRRFERQHDANSRHPCWNVREESAIEDDTHWYGRCQSAEQGWT